MDNLEHVLNFLIFKAHAAIFLMEAILRSAQGILILFLSFLKK